MFVLIMLDYIIIGLAENSKLGYAWLHMNLYTQMPPDWKSLFCSQFLNAQLNY